ncbi:MAG TPA: YceI family protein [Pyrinomonadaceae bacterium]|nr:YceI family protein [Pyrinomonadaceae bacterium]
MDAVRYRIDAGQSRFIVRGSADGLLSMFGHDPVIAIRGFGGDARFVPGTLDGASLLMLVQADSLAVVGNVSDKDRREMERAMREDLLETARHPEIVFMSTSVSTSRTGEGQYRARITGKLSLHGVTREHSIDARLTLGDSSLRAQGEFTLRQTDYDIKPVSIAGGTLKLKDELHFSFDIVAGQA